MFAVERASYPNPSSKREVEQAHIQNLLDQNDAPAPHNPHRELARLILATGSPTYLRAFTKYIQGRPLTPEEQESAAAPLTVQTDATGGYAVPFYFDPTILHTGAWTNINPYRQACTVKTIVGTDTYNAPTAAAFTVTRGAEAAPAAEGAGAVGQISAIVAKVNGYSALSMELLQDRPDIVAELASLISEAKDTEEATSFTTGIGDALGGGFNPIGMLPAHATAGAYTHIDTIAAAGAVAKEDAFAVESGLPIRHRSNAAWFMNRSVIRVFQALETTGGQLFGGNQYAQVGYPQYSPVGNTGLRLLQYPIYETPAAPAFVAATDDLVIACLCDPKSFYIVDRAGMTVETIPVVIDQATGRPTGQRGIYAWWRNTAKPANADAGRRLALLA
jgi:HK97 family phage major capsid protein